MIMVLLNISPFDKKVDYYHCYYSQAEKGQVELTEALESTKKALELRIDELLSEKEGAITAVRAELVESSKHTAIEKVTTSIINAVAFRKTKIAYNFGLSECNRVKSG